MQLGQSRTLPVEKPEQIDLAQAARYFGARGEADTALKISDIGILSEMS